MRVLVVLLAVAGAVRAEDLYEPVGPFGPKDVSFPWHCAFSPDGKWVAFVDGHTSYFTIWDFEERREVWSGDPPHGAYRVGWSDDSTRAATITRDAFVGVERGDDGWAADSVPLGFRPTIAKSTAPAPMRLRRDAKWAMFVDEGRIYSIEVGDAEADDVSTKGETAFHVMGLRKFETAVARLDPFKTEVSLRGTIVIKAIVLAGSPDGKLWLVAKNRKQLERGARINLEVVKADSGDRVAKFQASGRSPRPLVQAVFSPDSTLLATVEGDGDIVIRDAAIAKPLQKIQEYRRERYAMGVAFSPDGKWLVTGGRRKGEPGTLLWRRIEAK